MIRRRALAAAPGSIAVVAIGAAPARADGTWTVQAGNAPGAKIVAAALTTVGSVPQVQTCDGFMASGDQWSVQTTYSATANKASFNPIAITQP